jgi:plastocyanin
VRLFRSGTAHYDDVATRIVHDLGQQVIGFDVNGDVGATLTSRQVAEALRGVRPGSIVISHMNHPGHGTAAGMRAGLPSLKGKGVPLRARRRLHALRAGHGARGCAWPRFTAGILRLAASLNQAGAFYVVTRMRRYTLTSGAAAPSILLTACGSPSTVAQTASTPTSAAATTPATAAGTAAPVPGGIVISAFAYAGTLTVKAGQKVTVTNQDSAAHTLTDKKTHLFDTGNIAG